MSGTPMSTKRWYAAAYRAANGNVITLCPPNVIRKYAESDVAELQGQDPSSEFFVAFRDAPDWERDHA